SSSASARSRGRAGTSSARAPTRPARSSGRRSSRRACNAYARPVSTVHTEPPAEQGVRDGLSYALFLPADESTGGVVVTHGAGSQKENHVDFARECRAAGLAAVCFDQRGHGASEGALDGGAIDDVATVAALLPAGAPDALRGSSMGGWLALAAGAALDVAA